EDVEKQLARNVVPDTLALSDRFAEVGMALQLQLQVALKRLFDVFADQQLAQILQVGQPTEEENALDEPVGVLHFIERFLVRMLAEALEAPVVEHARVKKILIDRGQFVFQNGVQMTNDRSAALHLELR